MRRMLGISVLLIGVLSASEARATKLLAVLPIDLEMSQGKLSKASLASIEEMLSDIAVTSLRSHGWTVVSSDHVVGVLHFNSMKPEACGGPTCHLKMARALKADVFLSSTVRSIGGDLSIHVSLVETKSGYVVVEQQISGKTVKALREVFRAKAENFFAEAVAVEGPLAPNPEQSGGFTLLATPAEALLEVQGPDGFTASGRSRLVRTGIKPGSYQVKASCPGYVEWNGTLIVTDVEPALAELKLKKAGVEAPPTDDIKWLHE